MSTIARLTLEQYERMIAGGVFDPRDSNRIELIRGGCQQQPEIRPGRKGPACMAKSGIRDYWIVNLVDRCVEVYRDPLRSRYQSLTTYTRGSQVRLLAFPDVALDVSELFGSIGADVE